MTASSILACPTCGKKNRVPHAATGHPQCGSCHAALPWLVPAGDDDFAAVSKARVPVLVDLWAPWCGPCRTIAPLLEKSAQDYSGRLKIVKVNVDNSPLTAQRFGVQSIPTMLILKDGRESSRRIGALSRPALSAWIESELR